MSRVRRLLKLRHNVFFGAEPKPGDKRQGPPRYECDGWHAIAHARSIFAPISSDACGLPTHDDWFLAHQVRHGFQTYDGVQRGMACSLSGAAAAWFHVTARADSSLVRGAH